MSKNDKTAAEAQSSGEEIVEYRVPMDYSRGKSRSIFAAVNGETIRVKMGATVRIKRKFVQVIEEAERQKSAAHDLMDQMSNA